MPRKPERDRVAEWHKRVTSADKTYTEWEDRYDPQKLYNYYLGHQWPAELRENYTINLVFPTIEVQLPSQLFYHPRALVKPRPSRSDDMGSLAEARAALQQDTLNTFIGDPCLGFKQVTEDALLESYFRFGIVEVGYTADFIDNPNANKPILTEKTDDQGNKIPMMGADDKPVLQPEQTIERENLYLKHIPAKCFRVGMNGKRRLAQCDWYGYYEFHYPSDLKKNQRYKNTANVKTTGKVKADYAGDQPEGEGEGQEGMVKVWKIWDLRARQRLDFADGNEKFLLEEPLDTYDGKPVCPHAVMIKNPRLHEFYPLPPVFNWISPQDEKNEARNMQRTYRRKLVPKFGAKESVPQEELDKFLEAVIQVIRLQGPEDIFPIQNPNADSAVMRSLPATDDDFRQISGTSGEDRGVAEADTATQANIINFQSRIRENRARVQVADWLAEITRLMLYFIRTRMALPFWIQRNVDPMGPNAQMEALETAVIHQQITAEELGDLSNDVTVDVDSISAMTEAGERQDWIQALGMITTTASTPAGLALFSDETILRKTLGYFGIRSEKEIAAIRRSVQMMQMLAMASMAAGTGGQGGGQPKGQAGAATPGPTPDNPDIQQQLEAQMAPQQAM